MLQTIKMLNQVYRCLISVKYVLKVEQKSENTKELNWSVLIPCKYVHMYLLEYFKPNHET